MNEPIQGRQLASKWLKTQALLSSPEIAAHIPVSRLYRPSQLRVMLRRFRTVVIKPVIGSGGRGVIKISRSNGRYTCSYQTKRIYHLSFSQLLKEINRVKQRRPYLIQQGINLAQVGGRPIDYRVKYVKIRNRWHIRAMVGRVARRGLFVTNLSRGGRQLSASEGLRLSMPGRSAGKKQRMRTLTKRSTDLLERRFPGIGQLGFDYGIDRNGHIWILEVNTRPR